jgi:mono/diheme cytochrome c family protein
MIIHRFGHSLLSLASWRLGGVMLLSLSLSLSTLRAADTPTYAKHVQPILADRCYSCHGPEKQKGELRLDSVEAIRKGGKNGPILTPGDPAKSTLYSLTILPAGDDDIMPAKGDALTQAQTDAIRDWIKAGAVFDGVTGVAAKPEVVAGPVHLGPTDIDLVAAKLSKPDASAIKALTEVGGIVTPIGGSGAALGVDLSHLAAPLDASHLKQLERIAANVFWLDLQGSAITDAGLATVAKCRNLMRLHLNRTVVSDAGLATLKGLASLEYLNLVGTSIGDAGLAHLAGLTRLQRLYVMGTKVSDAGVAKLTATNATVTINRGPAFSKVDVPDADSSRRRR